MRRGNRHLVGVVLGGRSGELADPSCADLHPENLEKTPRPAHRRRVNERNFGANADVAEDGRRVHDRHRRFKSKAQLGRSAEPPTAPPARCDGTGYAITHRSRAAAIPQPQAAPPPGTEPRPSLAPFTNG